MDPTIKKQALRTLTYGLYIVMCAEGDEVNAFTANWLTQVSFEPPLLAVSIENSSKSLPMILRSRKFTVNTLYSSPEQQKLSGQLGKSGLKHPEKMATVGYTLDTDNFPILQDALAWVACSLTQTTPAGDSTLVVAEVVDAGILSTLSEHQSLTMQAAGFRHAG